MKIIKILFIPGNNVIYMLYDFAKFLLAIEDSIGKKLKGRMDRIYSFLIYFIGDYSRISKT